MSISDLANQIFSSLPRASYGGAPQKLLAVHGHGAPRWLIPQRDAAIRAGLSTWLPYRLSSRMSWDVVRAAHRLGLARHLPHVQTIELHRDTAVDWRALGWEGADVPAVSVYIGTPGPTQKAVLHLVNRDTHTCDAIVKVPLTDEARRAILHEAETLRVLAKELAARIPSVLSLDRERAISTQQFIPGRPGSRRLRPQYLQLLRSMMLPDERTTLAAHASAWKVSAADSPDAEVLLPAVAALDDDRPVPACRVHGDFAPWNIRERTNLPPALIDWEDAQPGGLPLQDAYHFLHIQDFLFGAQPTLHADALSEFASSFGLTAVHYRRLELAYLVHACLQCRTGQNHPRADFLIRTIGLAMRDYAINVCLPVPKLGCSPTGEPSGGLMNRADIFDGLIANLNDGNVVYCVLGGHDPAPESGTPDLDIMVRAEDRARIPEVLMRTARATGAQLIQALQHETTATYFILAHAGGEGVVHLDVDCYTDYRRDGRTWLRGAKTLANRRKFRNFYVPSVADQFTYYVLKKVLKQSITPHQLKRLQHLLARNPVDCHHQIASIWPGRVLTLQRTIAEQDIRGFRRQLPELHRELLASRPREPLSSRYTGTLRELLRRARRILEPTGMWVSVEGGTPRQRVHLAEELAERLAPAFRRTRVLAASGRNPSLCASMSILTSRIRSTLVITTPDKPAVLLHRLLRRSTQAGNLGFLPDFAVTLEALPTDAAEDLQQAVQRACEAVLHCLAARLRKRLRLAESRVPGVVCDTPDQRLSAVGSD